MKTIDLMLNQHPRAVPTSREAYSDAVSALGICEQICTSCADACLGETEDLNSLARCIRYCMDCAEICSTTARLITRQTETDAPVVQAQIHVCVLACQTCADECAAHTSRHGYCATCADTCRFCQEFCNRLLGEISSSGVREETFSTEHLESR